MMFFGIQETFDCPTAREDEAEKWLREKIEAIGGRLKKQINDHDFGPYPSFEAFFEGDVAEHRDCDDDTCSQPCDLGREYEELWGRINNVIEAYNKEFEEYL